MGKSCRLPRGSSRTDSCTPAGKCTAQQGFHRSNLFRILRCHCGDLGTKAGGFRTSFCDDSVKRIFLTGLHKSPSRRRDTCSSRKHARTRSSRHRDGGNRAVGAGRRAFPPTGPAELARAAAAFPADLCCPDRESPRPGAAVQKMDGAGARRLLALRRLGFGARGTAPSPDRATALFRPANGEASGLG